MDYSEAFYNSDGTAAPIVLLHKNIGKQLFVVAECVPDTRAKRLQIVSAYKKSSSEGQVLNMESENSPQPTSEVPHDGNATTDNSIPQEFDSVNRKLSTDALVTASGREKTKNTAEGGVKWAVRNNIVDENGRKYENVVELDYQTFNKVKRKGSLYIDFIRRHLINQKIEVFNSNGSKEIVEFARENERVTKDGSGNSRRVLGELT